MTGSRIFFAETYDVGTDLAVTAAESAGVCVRPHVRTVTDRVTGESVSVPIPCGSTREAVCPTCAVKARRLRMHQCREEWHRTDADLLPTEALDDQADKSQDEGDVDVQLEERGRSGRRVRSTRRLSGFLGSANGADGEPD